MKIARSAFTSLTLYYSAEASSFLNTTRQTICKWARSRRLEGQLVGNSWLFTEESLKAFLQGKTGCRRGRRDYSGDAADRPEYDSGEDGFHAIQRPLR